MNDSLNELAVHPDHSGCIIANRSSRTTSSPLVLDLDGDGIEITQMKNGTWAQIFFDHDADGVRIGTAWVKADDGLLVIDRNGNGAIDSGRELFGNNTLLSSGQTATDGYAALAELDSNGNGRIEAGDVAYRNIKVWRDFNQDGISDENELISLADAGITHIGLAKTDSSTKLEDGTRLDGSGGFIINNKERSYTDAWFANNAFYRKFIDSIPLTDAVRTLPNIGGSGMVRDLREAASLDATLVSDVNGLAGLGRAEMMGALDALIEHWAATSTMKTSFQQAQENGFILAYLPSSMSVAAYFAETDKANEALKARQQRIEKLITVLEHFNAQTFVDVGQAGITTGNGKFHAASPVPFSRTDQKYVFSTIYEPTQYELIEKSYAQLKESIHAGVRPRSKLKEFLFRRLW
jgi:hypothetical protein